MVKPIAVSTVAAEVAAEVLDEAALCLYLKTNPRMVRKMRAQLGLPYVALTRKSIRYRKPDVDNWLSRHYRVVAVA